MAISSRLYNRNLQVNVSKEHLVMLATSGVITVECTAPEGQFYGQVTLKISARTAKAAFEHLGYKPDAELVEEANKEVGLPQKGGK